jgi:hypothetical protein
MDIPVSQARRQTGMDSCIDNGTCIFYDSASTIPHSMQLSAQANKR